MLVSFYQLDTNLSHLGQGSPIEEMPPSDWLVDMSVKHFLDEWFMWEGPPPVEGSTSGQV